LTDELSAILCVISIAARSELKDTDYDLVLDYGHYLTGHTRSANVRDIYDISLLYAVVVVFRQNTTNLARARIEVLPNTDKIILTPLFLFVEAPATSSWKKH
jgi:hypothetical protein